MCGRYTLSETPEWSDLGIQVPAELLVTARYNAAPGKPQLVVTRQPGGLTLGERVWGAQLESGRVINARRESLGWATWRDHVARCAVPADGYVEWQAGPSGKQPLWLRSMDPAARTLFLAGLVLPSGFVVVTTPASSDVLPIHPRMPALLRADQLDAWLNLPFQQARALLRPAPSGSLTAVPLSTRINSVAHDDPACLQPASPAAPAAPTAPGQTPRASTQALRQLDLFGPPDRER
jgi:putative SOS response-associated peptidase YedK